MSTGVMNTAFQVQNEYYFQSYVKNLRKTENGAGVSFKERLEAQMQWKDQDRLGSQVKVKDQQKVSEQTKIRNGQEPSSQKTVKKEYPSAVEDWKKRHPESAYQVDGQVRAGREVLRKNGVENVDRDSMSMEEYKDFFAGLMNSIPYDSSQVRDVNVWSVTDKGWEQMKNDPDYEAWVLGYTVQDRSFHNPWAALPGVSPHFHTEKFGASIDEHLGQSFPMSTSEETEEETWWEKRHRIAKKIIEDGQKRAQEEHRVGNAEESPAVG